MKKVHQKEQKSKREALIYPIVVSLKKAGILLDLSARTIRRMSQAGILPPMVKVGGSTKISYQGIIDYLNNGGGGVL